MTQRNGSRSIPRPHEPPALEVRGLHAGYDGTIVVRDVAVTVPPASVVALLGPNGAGKTTLLRAVSGLIPAASGRVALFGADITTARPHRRAAAGLCHIPQGRGIYRALTVAENLRIQAEPGREAEAVERASTAFPILARRRAQRAGTLSGGEQQMLALAAAYVREPRVILVDEASLGLAPLVVGEIFEFLAQRAAAGAAILIVDQYATRALALADRAYIMRKGQVAFEGTADEARRSDLFAHYLGSTAAAAG
jgi:branched-chain amino acid transport system ATP-binding protein